MRRSINIIGNEYINKQQGLTYTVIEYVKTVNGHQYYKVRFNESGYEIVINKYSITNCNVCDKSIIRYSDNSEYLKNRKYIKNLDVNDIVGKTFTSKNQKLDYTVLEYVGKNHHGPLYIIKFIKSGNEKEYIRYKVIHGHVSDDNVKNRSSKRIQIGEVYVNNRGLEFTVIDKEQYIVDDIYRTTYKVKFLKSGYIKEYCQGCDIKRGEIRDRLTDLKVYVDRNNKRYTIPEVYEGNGFDKKCKVYYIESHKFYEANYYLAIKEKITEK